MLLKALADLVGTVSKLDLVQGVESDLRDRRRASLATVLTTVAVQVVIAVADKDYLDTIGSFFVNLALGKWDQLLEGWSVSTIVGVSVLVIGAVGFVTFRYSRVLLHESEEPFQYTFSVDPFVSLNQRDMQGTAPATGDANPSPSGDAADPRLLRQMAMLHHDLIDRLSSRVKRLSLLEIGSLDSGVKPQLASHIRIRGGYAVRDASDGGSVLEVAARVRIGGDDQPEELAPRVEIELGEEKRPEGEGARYRFVFEQVYSGVATAIYKRIRSDIRHKIKLFPTSYLRAVGLFHEAEDFEESNTVDAYDHAIALYRESLRYFETRRLRRLGRWLAGRPFLWHLVRRSQLVEARARVADARCRVYRRIVSALSGRTRNTLFHVPSQVEEAVRTLWILFGRAGFERGTGRDRGGAPPATSGGPSHYLIYPRGARGSRREPRFDRIRAALFEGLSVWSLAASQVGALAQARRQLRAARQVGPDLTESDPLFLLANAETEGRLNTKIQILRRAADLAPTFEIVHYRLAYAIDLQFRSRNELTAERARPVLAAYKTVQRLNPGNIGAHAAEGYLRWLLGQRAEAEKAYRAGRRIKAIRKETFVGDLNYGLARIAAEDCRFDEAFDLYRQALAADPGVGVAQPTGETRSQNQYFTLMVDSILARYADFRRRVFRLATRVAKANRARSDRAAGETSPSQRTLGGVRSLAANDYGNACLQYYYRTGVTLYHKRAVAQYRRARECAPDNAVTYFNLSAALSWEEGSNEAVEYLARAEQLEPGWREVLTQYLDRDQMNTNRELRDLETRRKGINEKIARLKRQESLRVPSSGSRIQKDLVELEEQRAALYRKLSTEPDGSRRGDLSAGRRGSVGPAVSDTAPVLTPDEAERLKKEIAELEAKISHARARLEREEARQARAEESKKELERTIGEETNQLAELDSRITDLQAERRKRMLSRLRRLTLGSNLALSFRSVQKEDLLRGVRGFLDSRLRTDRLDAESAGTLRLLAQFLTYHFLDGEEAEQDRGEEDLETILELVDYVEGEFFPEDFTTTLARQNLSYRLGDTAGKIHSFRTIRRAIQFSLDGDPTGHYLLKLALLYFDRPLFDLPPTSEKCTGLVKLVRTIEKPSPAPALLRQVFEKHGVRLSDALVGPSGEGAWQVSEQPAGSEFRVTVGTTSSDAPIVSVSFDDGRREQTLLRALGDLDDVRDDKRVAILHQMLGGLYGELGRDAAALEQFELALEKDDKNPDIFSALADHHGARGRNEEAAHYYRRATKLNPDDHRLFSRLSRAEQKLDDPRSLERAVEALETATRLAPNRLDYPARLLSLVERRDAARLVGYENLDKIPVVTPIALEVAADLIPLVEGSGSGLSEELGLLIETIRDEIQERFGVHVPGIRVRGNETDLPPGVYIIMINEIPLVSGTVDVDKRVARGSAADLGLAEDSVDAAFHPQTREEMSWLGPAEAERIADSGTETSSPLAFLVWHLGAVIRNNLAEFLGHQEVQNLLDRTDLDLEDRKAWDPGALTSLTSLLKALLEEEVPVADFEAIHRTFTAAKSDVALGEIAEEVRRLPEVAPKLPGSGRQARQYRLSREIEKLISDGLQVQGEVGVLALEPEPTQEILTAVRDAVGQDPSPGPAAIVVSDRKIRRATRKLVELEFPRLWVLTAGEFGTDEPPENAQLIELGA